MILELVNPSDAVTFVGDDPKIAGVAILLLGNGMYALTSPDGSQFVPLMMFGQHEEWIAEQGIGDLDTFITANSGAIADFLDTCAYGSIEEREAFDRAIALMTPENAEKHREWWNDRNRSSMNNIGAGARKLASALRAKAREHGVALEDRDEGQRQ